MKTVMKKMFSLLLVAVLLVGVFPMAAFADGIDLWFELHVDGSEPKSGEKISVSLGDSFTDEQLLEHAKGFWPEAFPAHYTYSVEGTKSIDGTASVYGVAVHVTPKTACEHCGSYDHATDACTYYDCCASWANHASSCVTFCDKNDACDASNHYADCPKHPDYVAPAPATATVDVIINNVGTGKSFTVDAGKNTAEVFEAFNASSLAAQYAGANGPILTLADSSSAVAATEAGKAYWLWLETAPISGSTPNPGTGDNNDTNTGDDNTTDDNNDPEPVCTKCNGAHDASNCPNNGDYDLKIYATMWTGDGREETVYLGTFYNLTTDTKIPEYMKENSSRIDTWVAAVCSGYIWNDRKIYENKWSTDQMEWNDRMGYTDQEAYINVFRSSKDVVIFLHTGRTYVDYDWIKVEGKTTNDTLTLDEAKAIVKKYYNFTDLKMYDNDDWNEYVDGNDNIKPSNAVPISDYNVTKIHVLMSGYSSKNYSGSNSGHTADSSNPKTGDAVFTPVIVMAASVSALATLFFLNKKRAY